MAQISKQVANRIKWARFVLSSARVDGSGLQGAFEQKYGDLVGYFGGTFTTLIDLMSARLQATTGQMRQAELALSQELSDDDGPRNLRDEWADQLRQLLFKARAAVDGGFGQAVSENYGLAKMPPRQPDRLLTFAANAMHLLRQDARVDAGAFGNPTDTLKIADVIQPAHDALADSLEAVDTETRQAHAARNRRDQIVEEWTQVYRGTATALSGLYQLAGRPDLAGRVRPTSQSVSGKSQPPADDNDNPLITTTPVEEPVEL